MTEMSLRFEPPFARIVLNRPDRRNAISRAMWRALPAIRAAIEAREDMLVALVEGEGAHFSAGDAHLAVTPARLGLIYGHAETRRLVELVGPSRAKDLLFTGRRIETEEALAIGLIDRRVPAGELAAAVESW